MKIFKILAMFLVTAIICLSIVNAVTGHGIKGNSNLNVVVLAKETGTGTGTGTGDEGGTANKKKRSEVIDPPELDFSEYYDWFHLKCFDVYKKYEVWCGPGGNVECEVGYEWPKISQHCIKY